MKNAMLILCSVLVLFLVGSTPTNATKKLEKLEVEVLYNAYDEEYIKNVVLDDGTKVKDYDYTITYTSINNLNTFSTYPIENYFHYAAWITRNGVISLSLDPTKEVRQNLAVKNDAWNLLKSRTDGFGSHPNWYNEEKLKWQFDCHFQFATFKDYWNLEPSSKSTSYADCVANGCQ